MAKPVYIKLFRPSGVPVEEGSEVSVSTKGFFGGMGKFKAGRGGVIELDGDIYGGKDIEVFCNEKNGERWRSTKDVYLSKNVQDAIPVDLKKQ